MAGKGKYPFQTTWTGNYGKKRRNNHTLGKQIFWADNDQSLKLILEDWFFESAGSVVNASATQVSTSISLTGGTQSVSSVENSSVTQVVGTISLSGGTQTLASKQNSAVTQVVSTLSLTGGTQEVTAKQNSSVTQVAGTLSITGGTIYDEDLANVITQQTTMRGWYQVSA